VLFGRGSSTQGPRCIGENAAAPPKTLKRAPRPFYSCGPAGSAHTRARAPAQPSCAGGGPFLSGALGACFSLNGPWIPGARRPAVAGSLSAHCALAGLYFWGLTRGRGRCARRPGESGVDAAGPATAPRAENIPSPPAPTASAKPSRASCPMLQCASARMFASTIINRRLPPTGPPPALRLFSLWNGVPATNRPLWAR
jgi:hypothetical protein